RTAPQTTIARRKMLVSRRRIVLGGGARDTAPEGLTARVARVNVTIARRSGRLCRFLGAQGRFGKRRPCSAVPSVPARVRTPNRVVRWNYAVGAALPKGRYFAFARAIDAAGNAERARTRDNLVSFRIR
ncbi:MAG TPA: hypothetical protein VGW75_00410, partial [Solirubrobacteraceae bacterium]|nr:hypothetical protein [Solirubrobacteraceae bacterium]